MNKIKKINVYTVKNHSNSDMWLKFLIHPIKSYWGDGTKEWKIYASEFLFYKKYFELSQDVKNSDAAFLPLTLNYYVKMSKLHIAKEFIFNSRDNNLKTYIWVEGDHEINFMKNSKDCIFIQYFGFKSDLKTNEIIKPGDLKKDLLLSFTEKKVKIRKKNKIPVVGFDGLASYPPHKLMNLIFKNIFSKVMYKINLKKINRDHIFPKFLLRKKILNSLDKNKNIKTNFNMRSTFAVGSLGSNKQLRFEFIRNILSSDYTLCFRGSGNYSLRFYETLCLGRIPLFINTDCKLPFEDKINWRDICLWVEFKDINYLSDIILDYHSSLSEKRFIDQQIYCREIWNKYLSKRGFCEHLNKSIRNQISFGNEKSYQ